MESSLNIMCAICSEFYKENDVVYSTISCGHLFHFHCVTRWLQTNHTCPQCRRNCERNRIHRVYLNFGERSAEDDLNTEVYKGDMWLPIDWQQNDRNDLEGAIKAGTDDEGNDAYVARVYFHEDLLPANYVPKKNGAYAPFGCEAHFLRQDVELLVDCDYKWVAESDGDTPDGAIITGYTETGENLYTGRGTYEGFTLPGKLHPSHGVLYMPYKGKEVNVKEYEILVRAPKEKEPQKQ